MPLLDGLFLKVSGILKIGVGGIGVMDVVVRLLMSGLEGSSETERIVSLYVLKKSSRTIMPTAYEADDHLWHDVRLRNNATRQVTVEKPS